MLGLFSSATPRKLPHFHCVRQEPPPRPELRAAASGPLPNPPDKCSIPRESRSRSSCVREISGFHSHPVRPNRRCAASPLPPLRAARHFPNSPTKHFRPAPEFPRLPPI